MKPVVLSPSQVSTARLCLRKWGWDKLAGKPRTTHPKAALGTRVHSILEAWLQHGTVPDVQETMKLPVKGKLKTFYPGRIAREGIKHLPKPKSPLMVVEQHFTMSTDVARYQGYRDVTVYHDDYPEVIDHKTTGDMRWAKTPKDLRHTDPQSAVYAASMVLENPSAPKGVDLNWVYYRTTGAPASKRVHLRVTADEALEMMDAVDETAAQMLSIRADWDSRALEEVTELPASLDACQGFGGCPYLNLCGDLTPSRRLRGHFEMGLLDDLKSAANKAANAAKPQTPAPEQPVAAPRGQTPAETSSDGVNPPEGRPAARAKRPGNLDLLDRADIQASPALSSLDKADKAARAAEEAKALEAKKEPTPPVLEEANITPKGVTGTLSVSAEVESPLWGNVLFVDCVLIDNIGDCHKAQTLAESAHAVVKTKANVPHYKFVEFGKGPAALELAAEAALEDFDATCMVVNTSNPEESDILPALLRWADCVVRGIR